jgi:hypothetical protein
MLPLASVPSAAAEAWRGGDKPPLRTLIEQTGEDAMVTITCDSCGKQKKNESVGNGENWVLGYDLEVETPNSLNHSVRFLDRWDDRRVLELGAIHFCSIKCRDKFLNRARVA